MRSKKFLMVLLSSMFCFLPLHHALLAPETKKKATKVTTTCSQCPNPAVVLFGPMTDNHKSVKQLLCKECGRCHKCKRNLSQIFKSFEIQQSYCIFFCDNCKYFCESCKNFFPLNQTTDIKVSNDDLSVMFRCDTCSSMNN